MMKNQKRRRAGTQSWLMLWSVCLLLLCLTGCGKNYQVDQALGLGTANETEKKDGVVYAVTDQNYAVIFALPNRQEVDLTAFGEPYKAVYLADSALDGAGKLAHLSWGDNVAYDPALEERLTGLQELSYPEDSLTTDWSMALAQAEQINRTRAEWGLEERVELSLPICQAARVRVEELQELYQSGARPDGRRSITALSDAGIPCDYLLTCIGTGETLEELTDTLNDDAVNAYWTYQNIVFSQMGLAVTKGSFDGEEQYGYTCFFVLPELTGVTIEGLTYERADDGIRITGCTEDARQISVPNEIAGYQVTAIAPDAFQNHPQLVSISFSTLPFLKELLAEDLFAGCDSLKAVTLPSYLDWSALALPETCRIFPYLMSMVDRQQYTHLAYVYVEDDAVYGLTQNYPSYPAVLMAVPEDRESFAIPEEVNGHRVAYVHEDALSQAPGLKEITVPDACAVEPGLLAELLASEGVVLHFEKGSMTDGMRWTIELAEQINTARAAAGLPLISPDLTLTQMAWGRAKDMNEVTDQQRANHQRPNGEDWMDIVSEPDIPYTVNGTYNHYTLAEDYQGIRSEGQIETILLPQFAEEFTSRTLGEGVLTDLVGMGLYYGEYQGEPAVFGVCVCGYREEEHGGN